MPIFDIPSVTANCKACYHSLKLVEPTSSENTDMYLKSHKFLVFQILVHGLRGAQIIEQFLRFDSTPFQITGCKGGVISQH